MTSLTRDELLDIIEKEAHVERARLSEDAKLEDLGLESLDFISIGFAIEDKTAVVLPEDAFNDCRTLGDMLRVLNEQLQKQQS